MKKIYLFLLIIFFAFYLAAQADFFIIGTEPGQGELMSPGQIEEGPNSQIYVYDTKSALIKIYSSIGKYIGKMGGKGEGPGEIKRVDGIYFGFLNDEPLLFFTEFFGGHKWITLMKLDGGFHDLLKPVIEKNFAFSRSHSLAKREFLGQMYFSQIAEHKNDYFLYKTPMALVKIDAGGRIVSEIIRSNPTTRVSLRPDGADSPIPFVPVFLWEPFKKNLILFADGLSQKLKVYDYNGKLKYRIKTELPSPRKVTESDLDKWRLGRQEIFKYRDSGWYKEFGKVIDKYRQSIHELIPNLSNLAITPEKNIFITGYWQDLSEKIDYWLLDENGKTILSIKSKVRDIKISRHYIFFNFIDEDENENIYCLKRQGTEKNDLERLARMFK